MVVRLVVVVFWFSLSLVLSRFSLPLGFCLLRIVPFSETIGCLFGSARKNGARVRLLFDCRGRGVWGVAPACLDSDHRLRRSRRRPLCLCFAFCMASALVVVDSARELG